MSKLTKKSLCNITSHVTNGLTPYFYITCARECIKINYVKVRAYHIYYSSSHTHGFDDIHIVIFNRLLLAISRFLLTRLLLVTDVSKKLSINWLITYSKPRACESLVSIYL